MQQWLQLIQQFVSETLNTSTRLLNKSFFNKNRTLEDRMKKIESISKHNYYIANEQQINYLSMTNYLQRSVSKLLTNDGQLTLAINFDEFGEVKETAII